MPGSRPPPLPGGTFRPTYRRLAVVKDLAPGVPVLALTATATAATRAEITRSLRMRQPRQYTATFNRPNLHYSVRLKELQAPARPTPSTLVPLVVVLSTLVP